MNYNLDSTQRYIDEVDAEIVGHRDRARRYLEMSRTVPVYFSLARSEMRSVVRWKQAREAHLAIDAEYAWLRGPV